MVSKHAVIFHGTCSSPEGNWFPWLKEELLKKGYKVSVPTFSTPEGQSLENWLKEFKEQVGELEENMILVGHSMGCGMILRLLENSSVCVDSCYLVSAWEGLLGSEEIDSLIKSFYETPINWGLVKSNSKSFVCYHGSDDPYIPLKMGQEVASCLNAEFNILDAAGHINSETGYLVFNGLLNAITLNK